MNKKLPQYRQFLINRLGYIRNKAGLSARELSLRLGFSHAYIAKFENGDFNISSEVLLDAINICNSTPEEFFSKDIQRYDDCREMMELYFSLTDDKRKAVKNLLLQFK